MLGGSRITNPALERGFIKITHAIAILKTTTATKLTKSLVEKKEPLWGPGKCPTVCRDRTQPHAREVIDVRDGGLLQGIVNTITTRAQDGSNGKPGEQKV